MFNPHQQEQISERNYGKKNKKNDNTDEIVIPKKFEGNKFFTPPDENLGPNINLKTGTNDEMDIIKLRKIATCNCDIATNDKVVTKNKDDETYQKSNLKNEIEGEMDYREKENKKKSAEEPTHQLRKKEKAKNKGENEFSFDDEESLTEAILQCQKIDDDEFLKANEELKEKQEKLEKETPQKEKPEKLETEIILESNLINSEQNEQILEIILKFKIQKNQEISEKIFKTEILSNNISLCIGLLFNFNLEEIKNSLEKGEHKITFTTFEENEIVKIEFTKESNQLNYNIGKDIIAPIIPILYLKKVNSDDIVQKKLSKNENFNNENINNQFKNKENSNKITLSKSHEFLSMSDEEFIDTSENGKIKDSGKKKRNHDQAKIARDEEIRCLLENQANIKKFESQLKELETEILNMKSSRFQEKEKIKEDIREGIREDIRESIKIAICEKEEERKVIRAVEKKEREEKAAKIYKEYEVLYRRITDLEIEVISRLKEAETRTHDKFNEIKKRVSILECHKGEVKKWSEEVERYLTVDLKNEINGIYDEFSRLRSYERNDRTNGRSPMLHNQYHHYQNNNQNHQQSQQNIYHNIEKDIQIRRVEDWQREAEKERIKEYERQKEFEKQKEKKYKEIEKDTYSNYHSNQNYPNSLNEHNKTEDFEFLNESKNTENVVIRDLKILEGKNFIDSRKKFENENIEKEKELTRKSRLNEKTKQNEYERSRSKSVNTYNEKEKEKEKENKKKELKKIEFEIEKEKKKNIQKEILYKEEEEESSSSYESIKNNKKLNKNEPIQKDKQFTNFPTFLPQNNSNRNLYETEDEKVKLVWHLFPSMTLEHPETNLPVMVVKNEEGFDIDGSKITYYNAKHDWGQMKGSMIAYQNPRNDPTVEFKVLKTKYINSNFGIGIVNNVTPSEEDTKVYAQYPDVDKYYFEHAIIYNTGNCQLWKIERTNKQIFVTKGTGLKVGDIMRMVVNLERGEIIWIVNKTEVGRMSHKILMNPHYQWNRFLLMKNDEDAIEIL